MIPPFDVDLTDAARAYGLDYVPPVLWDLDASGYGDAVAGFREGDHAIHASVDYLTDPVTFATAYEQSRFTNVGAPHLTGDDPIKFVLAHELWHALQYERAPEVMHRSAAQIDFMAMLGIDVHDEDEAERSADVHAAKVYPLVHITRHQGEYRHPDAPVWNPDGQHA